MLSFIRIGTTIFSFLFLSMASDASAQTVPDSLPPLDSLDFDEMYQISGRLFMAAQDIEAVLVVQDQKNEDTLSAIRSMQALAKADSTTSKNVLDSLSRAVKTARQQLKKSNQQLARARKAVTFTGTVTNMTDTLLLRRSLPKAWSQVSDLYREIYPPLPDSNAVYDGNEPGNAAMEEKKRRPDNKNNVSAQPYGKRYDPAADVMLTPPIPPCVVSSSTRDEFSGEISRQLAYAELFRYTNPALKTYLQGKTHVICEAALSSTGSKATLLLTFKINDPNARKAFGRLEKNSLAMLKFIDGSTFELQNSIGDDGTFSPDNESSVYHAQYPLSTEALKKIRRNELDKLRILWSKGYDDYDIQQVALLMWQAECLFK